MENPSTSRNGCFIKAGWTASKIIETKNGDHPDRIQGAIVSSLSSRSGHMTEACFGRKPFSDPCPTCGKNPWVWFLHDEKLFANQVKTHCARMATHLKKCVGKGEVWIYRRSHWSCFENGEKKVKRVPPFTPIWRNSMGRFSLDKLKDC